MEKCSELEEGNPVRKFKGRTVFQGNKVTDESSEVALFAELASASISFKHRVGLDGWHVGPLSTSACSVQIGACEQAPNAAPMMEFT